jgi:hypothetical protein
MSGSLQVGAKLADLLVQRVTGGLSAVESRELGCLLEALPGCDVDTLAPAAAALTLAARLPLESMPTDLQLRLGAEGRTMVRELFAGKVVSLTDRSRCLR